MNDRDYVIHYNHIQNIHRKLLDHSWCRKQTQYDSEFIAWLTDEMQKISNEAYLITQVGGEL